LSAFLDIEGYYDEETSTFHLGTMKLAVGDPVVLASEIAEVFLQFV
jgi:hypothetical protein